jgi:hypothetical protein
VRRFGGRISCGRSHDRGEPLLDLEGPEHPARSRDLAGRRDRVAPRETRGGAQALVGDLMAERARHTVVRQTLASISACSDWQMREHCALAARHPCLRPRHRHMARRAFVLNGSRRRGMVQHLPANGCLPVRIPGGVRHHRRTPVGANRDILPRRRTKPVVARQAAIRCLEHLVRRTPILCAERHDGDERQQQHAEAEQTRHHPEKNPPSNQSQRR